VSHIRAARALIRNSIGIHINTASLLNVYRVIASIVIAINGGDEFDADRFDASCVAHQKISDRERPHSERRTRGEICERTEWSKRTTQHWSLAVWASRFSRSDSRIIKPRINAVASATPRPWISNATASALLCGEA
jgi:hypothetical protein